MPIESILIAEDDAMLGDLWREAFNRAGHTVNLVRDGREAIAFLHDNELPDVLITDYNMPYADGLEVLHELAKINPEHTVTTVMITANHMVQYAEGADTVADMFLVKPVGFRDMVRLVERLCSIAR